MAKKFIPRDSYIQQIRPFINQNLIKVLMGQRRVGKSYILLQLIEEIKQNCTDANIIFIDKELDDFSDLQDNKSLYAFVASKLKAKNNYLFIDEVQEIQSFELCLRSLLNEQKCDIYCTGSNAQILSGELSTHLAGRYVAFTVHSLSFQEFLAFHQLEKNNAALNSYLTIGGLPYLANLQPKENVAFEYLKNVYASILLKDVVARENIRNVSFLEDLVAYLSDNTGSLFSAHNISKYLKSQHISLTPQTIMNYLHTLCNAFFIYRVPRADVTGLKIFEVGEKYYFEDLGIRNILRSFNFRKDVGKLMENAVYMHLIRNNYTVYVGKLQDKEIDFVAEKGGKRLYVQVTYMLYDEKIIEREFGNLLQIPDQYPKFVVSMDEIRVDDYKGIHQVHLLDFLAEDI